MNEHRLGVQPGEVLDRSTPVRFRWNGHRVEGFRGDTIASTMLANGHRIFSRSMKYHRPRGVLTADYWDPNTNVQVGPEPNVRAGHRLAETGLDVRPQNVWPSLDVDVKALNGLAARFLTAGFYYKTFMRPQRVWPLYERVLARFAPGGTVDLDAPPGLYDTRNAHPDVVVAGGGPAGLAAAVAAAEAGATVMLVEHEHRVGGHLRWGDAASRAVVAELTAAAVDAGVEVLVDSTVTGRYADNLVAVVQRSHPSVTERLIRARAKVLVVAPGLIERPYVFAGNDLPGVMLSGAARRLVNLWAVRPGERAVVLTANPDGDATVADLERAGVDVAGVVDARRGETLTRATGSSKQLGEVVLGDGTRIEADLLVTAVGWTAPTSLVNMAGDRPHHDPVAARFFPTEPPDDVLVTGGLAGDGTLEELLAHASATGTLAARRSAVVAHRRRAATARARAVAVAEPAWPGDDRLSLGREPHPSLHRATTHGIVDYSEDVTSKDLLDAAAEGFDSVELLKRFTTATMGPAQGKLETVNTVAILAEARGESIDDVGTTVWRPPFAPISLGALCGRVHEPVRRSPLHEWHVTRGMTPIVAGRWIRPEHYGDPLAEVRSVRSSVGITDVTPLGKFDLRGPDVVALLELLYTNRWAQLPIGGVRYGVMCADDGVVLDDGVTGRLGDDHYLMTTTSSGAGTVSQWIEMWLQTEHPEWRVHATPMTAAYTSINVAGPRSRELLTRLIDDVDLSPGAFAYMQVRTGTVAGVAECVMWRIGFTGELSFELHVPAGFGLHVWERLLDAGADLGVAPFGLEAQRIMRLEKGHFIVGQDTDGLTLAPSLGLDALLRLDKPDFAGRPEVEWARRDADHLPRLVALQPTDPMLVPAEACQILRPGTAQIAGRITSSRFSPTLDRSICLGQVAADLAEPGTIVHIRLVDGTDAPARVMERHAHFDPEGVRLRG